jgi:hypothetical protein
MEPVYADANHLPYITLLRRLLVLCAVLNRIDKPLKRNLNPCGVVHKKHGKLEDYPVPNRVTTPSLKVEIVRVTALLVKMGAEVAVVRIDIPMLTPAIRALSFFNLSEIAPSKRLDLMAAPTQDFYIPPRLIA